MVKNKGFRDGQKEKLKEEFYKSLSKEEIARIEEQRKFESVKEGTLTFDLALHMDQLRMSLRENKCEIEKMIWNISNMRIHIRKCEDQLTLGNITEMLTDKQTMNEAELKNHIVHQKWLIRKELQSIAKTLLDIRSVVGHTDIKKSVVFSDAQFENYAREVMLKLKELGFDIFKNDF